MYSLTVRNIYRKYHDLDVGLYTIGPCEAGPDHLGPGTSIGRYCSIYYTVSTSCGEPLEEWQARARSLGPKPVPHRRLVIGNDVFIGHNAIILPTVERIGDGAFIGAGSVVQTSVPPYAVLIGNPARVVKYRFSEKTIAEMLASKWWDRSLIELRREWETFQTPLDGDGDGALKRADGRSPVPTAAV